jgi:2-polyprenyl-3-methyl-5-hydroxy-6-metoxy-1,4-benzoquinol methylase
MSQPSVGALESASEWTKADVERLLQEETFAYHRVELPFGLATPGVDRSATAALLFPDDLRGKTVLDVGCKYGSFCFEAERRGASRVVGIDVDPESVRKAKLLGSARGSAVEFALRDVEREELAEFDYVLCLNVLHHLADPVGALAKLARAARERLVLEVATLGLHDLRKLRIGPLRAFVLARSPVLYVAPRRVRETAGQTFFLSRSALRGLLEQQGGALARIDEVPSGFKNRRLTIAHRRWIGRMALVAGPTSAGKSTLIDRLGKGELPELAKTLELGDPASWPVVSAAQIPRLTDPRMERLLFHYDTLRPYLRSAKTHARERSLDICDAAAELDSVTIVASPETLRRQLESSEIAPKRRFGVYVGRRRHWTIREDYQHVERIFRFYEGWFDWLLARPGRHWLVAADDGFQPQPASAWRERLAELGVRP